MYAERCRTEGRLMEAEAVCRQILQAQPNLPEAEHLLGVIAHQNGKLADAIEHVQRAVKLAPQVALVSRQSRRDAAACRPPQTCRRAGAARARDRARHAGGAQQSRRRAVRAERLRGGAARAQRKAIAAKPDFAEAHSNLGNALHALRRFDEAIAAYRRAIELKPNYADAWANLGTTLHHSGSFERRHVGAAPRHRAGAASRQCPFRARHSPSDARRSRRRLGRIRMAAALDRAQRPAISGKAVAGRKPRRQAHLCPGRAGISATRCNSPATCRCLPRAPAR